MCEVAHTASGEMCLGFDELGSLWNPLEPRWPDCIDLVVGAGMEEE